MEPARLFTEDSEATLDDLLERICAKIQLPKSYYDKAVQRYTSVADWIGGNGSPLARFDPDIYPQGSMSIGTTVRLKERNEFDLDFVCEFRQAKRLEDQPMALLNLVEKRLRDNELYKDKLERKNRCVRLNYADEFYMDILPAIPNPVNGPHCVLVPDRKAQDWKDSNPKGYRDWFNGRLVIMERMFKAQVEKLPDQEPTDKKAPLKRAVQLIKRHRDIFFKDASNAPISIVLTTLAGDHYQNESSVMSSIADILEGIRQQIRSTNGRIIVKNPSNFDEDLSEKWDSDPAAYKAFSDWIDRFAGKWATLSTAIGMDQIGQIMEGLFGEAVRQVIREQAEFVQDLRKSQRLTTSGPTLRIVENAAVGGAVGIRPNRFFGE